MSPARSTSNPRRGISAVPRRVTCRLLKSILPCLTSFTAFPISLVFWLLQTLNNDYEADFSIPVRLKGVPNNVVITSEPASELRIKVKDKGTVLLNYMLGKSFYPVILDYADYKGVDNQVRIYPSQFEKKVLNQLNASTRLLSMKPDTLEYIYSTGASKLVPVKLRGTLSAGREYYLSDTIFSPDSVLVYAPQGVLDTIAVAYTQPVNATVVAGMFALINYRIKMLTLGKVAVAVVDDDEEDI